MWWADCFRAALAGCRAVIRASRAAVRALGPGCGPGVCGSRHEAGASPGRRGNPRALARAPSPTRVWAWRHRTAVVTVACEQELLYATSTSGVGMRRALCAAMAAL